MAVNEGSEMANRSPTIEDVARAAGVSRATTSRVINNLPGVSGQVRARVNQAVAALGYQPNAAARALASGRAPVIDLVVVAHKKCGLAGDGCVMSGPGGALDDTGTAMRVRPVSPSDVSDTLDRLADGVTTGAVLVNVPPPMAARFHRRCQRVVSLGRSAVQIPAVEAENETGAHAAVEHLYGGFWRVRGYRAATQLVAADPENPSLTTVRLPVEDMAVAATRTLLNDEAEPYFRRVFPVDLVVRRSTSQS